MLRWERAGRCRASAHVYFLIGLRNRLAVALSWLWIYSTGQHSARLITGRMRRKGAVAWNSEAGRVSDLSFRQNGLKRKATARREIIPYSGLQCPALALHVADVRKRG